jgi:glutamine amidotransferase
MIRIGLINYGMGNLTSISNVLDFYCVHYEFINYTDSEYIKSFDGYILPGVGSFKYAMDIINSSGLKDFILREAYKNKPILGICLGMQLLLDKSSEGGTSRGLSLVEGSVHKFDNSKFIIPHVGWNQVVFTSPHSTLYKGIDNSRDYYFDHSYYVQTHINNIIATTDYIKTFPAIINKNNIFGVQFHPEKSQIHGLEMIKNFISFCNISNA